MTGLEHWLTSLSGAAALSVWLAAGALVVLFVAAGVITLGRSMPVGTTGTLWRGALVVLGALLAWTVLDRSAGQEQAAARRALDARAAELTARAIAPGSALACLDAVANASVEAACEKAVFASPEAIAAAVAYVDARLALLADGLEFAARDRSYEPTLERLRRAIEADRFGVVAHVLATRGCAADECAAFKLMRDPQRIVANLNERTFDANVVMHAAAWRSEGPAVAASPAPAGAPALAAAAPSAAAPGVPLSSKYDFPSAASIPPVSIMNAEPPPAPDANAASGAAPNAAPGTRPPAAPPRRQSTREPAPPVPLAPSPSPPAPPAAPTASNSQSLR